MSIIDTVLRQLFEGKHTSSTLVVAWHAGEPLAVPRSFYDEAFAVIERLRPTDVKVQHNFQTNATLVDEKWCAFFRQYDAKVGVSIDGPAHLHDEARRTRSGRGTHASVMLGISKLVDASIPLEAIAVVRRSTLMHAKSFIDFFVEAGFRSLALNIEEIEGMNRSSSLNYTDVVEDYKNFVRIVYHVARKGRIRVREIHDMRDTLLGALPRVPTLYQPGANVTVDWQGNFTLFAPELLGAIHDRLGTLNLGNVEYVSLIEAFASERSQKIRDEMERGLEACANSCAYFDYCSGNSPSNKFFEHGSFYATETLDCRLNRKAVADVVLEELEATLTKQANNFVDSPCMVTRG